MAEWQTRRTQKPRTARQLSQSASFEGAHESGQGASRPEVAIHGAPLANAGEVLDTEPATAGGASPNPRAATLARLAEDLRALAAAGDLEGARIVHETIARLLGAEGGSGAAVMDLSRERERRGGR